MLKGPKGRELEILEFHTPQESLRSPLIYKLWAHQNSLDTTEFFGIKYWRRFFKFYRNIFLQLVQVQALPSETAVCCTQTKAKPRS